MAVKRKRRTTKKSRTKRTKRKTVLTLVRKRTRKKRRVIRVRKNPSAKFVIRATLERSGKLFYFRASTKSFVPVRSEATLFKSMPLAGRTARAIVGQLPSNIRSIHVDMVR